MKKARFRLVAGVLLIIALGLLSFFTGDFFRTGEAAGMAEGI